jgi:hypothetical protein
MINTVMSKKTVKNQEYSLSEEGFEFLKTLEICRYKPKMDSSGQLVVGYRHYGDDIDPQHEYTEEEIMEKYPHIYNRMVNYGNIIIKFGRFRPGQEPHYDEVLGVKLASNNQYAKRVNNERI